MSRFVSMTMVVLLCSPALATLHLYDGFDYPSGTPIAQNGWNKKLFEITSPIVSSLEIAPGKGNSVTSDQPEAAYAYRVRSLPVPIDVTSQAVYISALMKQYREGTHPENNLTIGLSNANSTGRKIEVRFYSHANQIDITGNGEHTFSTGTVYDIDRLYQCVVRIRPIPGEAHKVLVDAGFFDVTEAGLPDEDAFVFQFSDFTYVPTNGVLDSPFGDAILGFRGDVTLADDYMVTDSWVDLQTGPAPPPELLAHLPFDTVSEDTTTTPDVTGNGHDGLLGSLNRRVSGITGGRLGVAMHFDGIGFVTLIDSNSLPINNANNTFMLWLKTTSDASMQLLTHMPVDGVHRPQDRALAMNAKGENPGVLMVDHGWVGACHGQTAVNDGEWHHAAVTVQHRLDANGFDVEDVKLFVDGFEDGNAVWVEDKPGNAGPYADNFVHVGGGSDSDWFPNAFMGALDDVRIFDQPFDPKLMGQFNPESFITFPPTVETRDASLIGQTGALLHGFLVDDGGMVCDTRFRYWPKSGGPEIATPWGAGASSGWTLSEFVKGLTPDTLYVFVAEARNIAGDTAGEEMEFKTLSQNLIKGAINNGNLDSGIPNSGWDAAVPGVKFDRNSSSGGASGFMDGWTLTRTGYSGGNNTFGFRPIGFISGLGAFVNSGDVDLESDTINAALSPGDTLTLSFDYGSDHPGGGSGFTVTPVLVFNSGSHFFATTSPVGASDGAQSFSETIVLTASYTSVSVLLEMENASVGVRGLIDDIELIHIIAP